MQSIQVKGPTSTLLNLGYHYDSYGNIKQLTDGPNGAATSAQTDNFAYDDQNRLSTAYAKQYAYDPAGRLTQYEDAATTLTPNFPVHAQKNAGYAYNANGNLVNRAGQTLTWDVENHLQRVTGPGVDEQYRYDESGQRLQKIVGDQVTTYVNSQYEAQQAICTGQTPAGNTNWQTYDSAGVYLDVDTRRCGFAATPLYFTTLEGTTNHDLTTGAQAIYFATATGFRVYLRFTDGRAFTPADANGWGWRLTWHATPKSLVSSQLCTGQTPAGNTNWQTYGANGLYLDVDTRACGYASTPLYQTSLMGATSHWTLTGITAIYTPTPTGFRVYLHDSTGATLTPSIANGYGWQLAWNATPTAVQTPTLCSGQTPGGSTNWQANGSNSLYLDVNTTACGFTTTPRYLTALSGSNHWTILGVNAIYTPTPTGFRVYVRTSDGSALTPAAANGWGWSLTWRAVNRQYAVVTQAYSFNGQRIALRKDGVLTYLHADHLGSTLLATDAQGNVVGGNQPRYFAYGRERTPSLAALPTDYTYTGQKQDGSGLVYMNARYYDPQIGQFISPDTEVPDPTSLSSYNRFMYGNGNPLSYNDPSGHQASCTMDSNLKINCGDTTVGAHTQTSPVNPVTATQFGPPQPTDAEIIAKTARQVAEQLKHLVLYYNKDGSIDWNATLGNSVGAPLSVCAKAAGGVCGVSVGGSVGLGGGIRGSLDFYVDQNGHWDLFGTVGGGGYIPPIAFVSGGATIAHIETSKWSLAVIHNANIGDMKGWSGQFGFSTVVGSGLATEWVFGKNSQGNYWRGLSVGKADGTAIDVHLTATYSWSAQQIRNQTLQKMFEQLKVSR